ncbi:MAG: HEAT repeat domain-containing protein [Planctomycetota bacterium]
MIKKNTTIFCAATILLLVLFASYIIAQDNPEKELQNIIEKLKSTNNQERAQAVQNAIQHKNKAVDAIIELWNELDFGQTINNNEEKMIIRSTVQTLVGIESEKSFHALSCLCVNHKNSRVRAELTRLLGIANNDNITNLLIRLSKEDKDSYVRKTALFTLSKLKNPASLEAITNVLKNDMDTEVRKRAAEILLNTNNEKYLPFILEALKNDLSMDFRIWLIDTLCNVKNVDVVKLLNEVLSCETSLEVKRAIVTSIISFNNDSSFETLLSILKNDPLAECRLLALHSLNITKGEIVINALLETLLKDKSEDVRATAAEKLGNVKDDKVTKALLKSLNEDKSSFVLKVVIDSIGKRKIKDAVPVLVKNLKELKNEGLTAAAAEAIGNIGDKSAVPLLLEALKNFKDAAAISAVASALISLEDDKVWRILGEILTSDSDEYTRAAAAYAFGKTGKEEAVIYLTCSLNKDTSKAVKYYAADSITKLSTGVAAMYLPEVLSALSGDVTEHIKHFFDADSMYRTNWYRDRIIKNIIGNNKTFENISSNAIKLKTWSSVVKRFAAFGEEVLDEEGKKKVDAYIKDLNDDKWRIREEAARSLKIIGVAAEPYLKKVVEEGSQTAKYAAELILRELDLSHEAYEYAKRKNLNTNITILITLLFDPDKSISDAIRTRLTQIMQTEIPNEIPDLIKLCIEYKRKK